LIGGIGEQDERFEERAGRALGEEPLLGRRGHARGFVSRVEQAGRAEVHRTLGDARPIERGDHAERLPVQSLDGRVHQVTSTQPIVVERAQYWPGPPDQWYEAHNSFGVTQLGMAWGLAEGRSGGPANYKTFILIANPGAEAANLNLYTLTTDAPVSNRPYKRLVIEPNSRLTLPMEVVAPGEATAEFGAYIQADRPVAVERAMYSDALGQTFAAGTNATATRLP
jgi:hypothetical protein